jgi:TPR repeat protein
MASEIVEGAYACCCGAVVLITLANPLALADPYEDAETAIKAGNEDRAIALLRPPAAKGETQAQYEVGELLYLFKKQNKEAKELFEKAATKRHGEAMYFLANINQNGKVVPNTNGTCSRLNRPPLKERVTVIQK